ncbi:MAG: RidA family protein [Erysipelotrichaceae bacterium]
MKKIIDSKEAPSAIGPYSQANLSGDLLFISGQLPIDVKTGKFAGDSIEEQTTQSLENAKAILLEAGFSLNDVVKTTVLMQDISEFAQMNEIYAKYFTSEYPARAAYEVAKLPLGARVEIEMIAKK